MSNSLRRARNCFQPRQWFAGEGEPDPFTISEEDTFMWVYSKVGDRFTVGYFCPDGSWFAESEYDEKDKAVARVRYLNGGN